MKIGFNEGSDWDCKNHSVMKDLEYCEKYGFDYIDIQNRCLDRELAKGSVTLKELGEWFRTHKLKVSSYNALCDFNMCDSEKEEQDKLSELEEAVKRCILLETDRIIVVPRANLKIPATIPEIHADAVRMLKKMVKIAEPHQIRLALEFCGQPNVSINRFREAYAIVQEINHPLVGMTFDNYHFHAMGSEWADFEHADGRKIFAWHVNDTENLPVGASYNTYANRLWPGDPRGCMDLQRYADTLKNIGYQEDICILEVFRPEYYGLSQEDNVRQSAECMKAFAMNYCEDF